jgi:hypothetical protein
MRDRRRFSPGLRSARARVGGHERRLVQRRASGQCGPDQPISSFHPLRDCRHFGRRRRRWRRMPFLVRNARFDGDSASQDCKEISLRPPDTRLSRAAFEHFSRVSRLRRRPLLGGSSRRRAIDQGAQTDRQNVFLGLDQGSALVPMCARSERPAGDCVLWACQLLCGRASPYSVAGVLSGCTATTEGGGDYVSHYEPVASAPTWDGLKGAMLGYKERASRLGADTSARRRRRRGRPRRRARGGPAQPQRPTRVSGRCLAPPTQGRGVPASGSSASTDRHRCMCNPRRAS